MSTLYLISIVLLLAAALAFFFLYRQQRFLQKIRAEHRAMIPGYVWLQLIPLFGLYWQFKVVKGISDSVSNELSSRYDEGSVIASHHDFDPKKKLLYNEGLAYCILSCAMAIPVPGVKFFFAVPALATMFWYAIRLRRVETRLIDAI